MRTKELMIGDWVYGKEKNKYGRVDKLEHDVEDDTVEPIPITEEILKKNGFLLKRDEIFGWYFCGDVSLEYTADGRHDDAYWAFTCGNKDNDVCLIVMHYVHELQHALRLCKIDKEIEL
jgi:hypothetical protein